ncbi:RAVE complex protein Rav1 [Nannochloropsis gaditana]|uniref:RAVE complex protein Rav1 n=1 Tax=Nannochloropsis gaditana TaxID=72520 RepID=W7T708_9STRA|nr:RAVE complex protein Rav1 [Nannochloropsis gaditana]
MQAALLYLAAGRRTTLSNLAKAAREDKKALARLLQFDLNSARGRQVVEKNAYHLLRHRAYLSAAALFLLPDPPQLTLCLDVLVRHMKDPLLALLVARLVESGLHPDLGGDERGGAVRVGRCTP